jgi:hypothetical protein
MPVSQTVAVGTKKSRLLARRTLEKANRSTVQFGKKIFKNARR